MPAFPMDRLLEYLSHHPWLATATAVVVALIAVYEMRARSESLVSVTPQELIRLMNQGALLLDLRAPEQYQAGHLAGARQMSGEQILKAADSLKKHKEKPVVVYDDSGSLGSAAARQLAAQGFTRAFTLRGGYAADWCGYCARARRLLDAKGVAVEEIDVEAVPGAQAEMLARCGRSSVPQIFIGDEHIGGADELDALEAAGRLDPMLK